MTSFRSSAGQIGMDEGEHALRIALSELGWFSEDPRVRELLKELIDGAMERGGRNPAALAHAAIDEVVLSTCGRVRPLMLG